MWDTILEGTGSSVTSHELPWGPARKAIEIGDFVVNPYKIHKMLGWWPKTSLKEGLQKTLAFYKERQEEYF